MKRLLTAAGLLSLALVLVACSGTSGAPTAPASISPDALRISSKDLKFSTDRLQAPAGKAFQIVYENQESAPHNVAIYKDESAAEKVFVEEPFSGPRTVVYEVPALAPSTYFFRCDIHPNMKGSLVVQ